MVDAWRKTLKPNLSMWMIWWYDFQWRNSSWKWGTNFRELFVPQWRLQFISLIGNIWWYAILSAPSMSLTYFLKCFLSLSAHISLSEIIQRSWFWFKCASLWISHRLQYSCYHSDEPFVFFSILKQKLDEEIPSPSWEGYLWEQNDLVWPIRPHASSKFCCGWDYLNCQVQKETRSDLPAVEKVKQFYSTCKEKKPSIMGTNFPCAQSKLISFSLPEILHWFKSQSSQDLKMLTNAGFTSQFFASSENSYWVCWTIFEWETKTASSSTNSSVSVCKCMFSLCSLTPVPHAAHTGFACSFPLLLLSSRHALLLVQCCCG